MEPLHHCALPMSHSRASLVFMQVVLYPIVDIRGLNVGARAYVEGLEDTMIRAVGAYGVHARVQNLPSLQGSAMRQNMFSTLTAST